MPAQTLEAIQTGGRLARTALAGAAAHALRTVPAHCATCAPAAAPLRPRGLDKVATKWTEAPALFPAVATREVIVENVAAVLDISTFANTPKTLFYDTSISTVPMNGTKNGMPFDKQPPAQEPPLHMLFPSNDLALITAFSYERHTGLVPTVDLCICWTTDVHGKAAFATRYAADGYLTANVNLGTLLTVFHAAQATALEQVQIIRLRGGGPIGTPLYPATPPPSPPADSPFKEVFDAVVGVFDLSDWETACTHLHSALAAAPLEQHAISCVETSVKELHILQLVHGQMEPNRAFAKLSETMQKLRRALPDQLCVALQDGFASKVLQWGVIGHVMGGHFSEPIEAHGVSALLDRYQWPRDRSTRDPVHTLITLLAQAAADFQMTCTAAGMQSSRSKAHECMGRAGERYIAVEQRVLSKHRARSGMPEHVAEQVATSARSLAEIVIEESMGRAEFNLQSSQSLGSGSEAAGGSSSSSSAASTSCIWNRQPPNLKARQASQGVIKNIRQCHSDDVALHSAPTETPRAASDNSITAEPTPADRPLDDTSEDREAGTISLSMARLELADAISEPQHQNEADSELCEADSGLCVICWEGPKTHVVVPCGHQCVCDSCSSAIGQRCPMCRGDVERVVKVFL